MVELASLSLEDSSAVECCQAAAGSSGGMLLADIGSDVLEVERRLGGDGFRIRPPLTKGPGDPSHRWIRRPVRAFDLSCAR
ncbi:MAG: hypothetical protein E5V72_00260 [Mesorhizobium sp.]|uniref:CoA transferase n=1 Tax=Mesorhizobium sp. TaxID=1871066 RepID=UPI000FE68676|nr:MAG: hypothetical protein EOQ43_09130 [Mesorhizobium sp.]RWB79876.1 MAG: hypothetical protein EOQ42_05610 [Mesorhizobium sp.]RWF77922.1 MAG: hypothetical protein EOS26_07075 [Mesorhizobium sp.]TIS68519.1 MAG: hypothetical protein E5W92_04755 [Mesorhizobium sp.]TIW51075.1 MAG: hypothetical protein E5V72_00260 [Mesorhizobium sp.]